MHLIGDADARIPLEYDPSYTFNDTSAGKRAEYYTTFSDEDFFEVAIDDGKIVGFHAIRIIPYPPNFRVGNISTLWVSEAQRGLGIAEKLKKLGEDWGRKHGLLFLQTNVHVKNHRMIEINEGAGYTTEYLHMRLRL